MVRVTTTLLVMLSMGASPLVLPASAQDTNALGDLVEQAEADKVDAELPEEIELLTDTELDTLVAPVALYPDALLAQVLVAATFPLQVVKADRLLADSEGMSDDDLKAAIAEQEWDPSVLVLLSGFPTVVQRMSDDLAWTEELGNAMVQQDQDVLAAVQRMRAQAQDTGYLATNEAHTVEEEDGQIYITPTDPKVVYVPTYDTNTVYTQAPTAQPYIQPYNQPYVVPQQQTSSNPLANPLLAGALGFGGAMLVQELWGNDDDDNNDDGWDDYWNRRRPIDYDNRQFYPRPRPYTPAYSWQQERDRSWDRNDWGWRRDAAARRAWEEDRRDAARWAVVRNPVTGEPQIKHMRDRIRLTPARERDRIQIDRNEEALKRAQQRRQQEARQERQKEVDKRDDAQARQEARARAERQEARAKAERQEARERAEKQDARAKAERQEAREKAAKQEQRAKAQSDAERKQQAEARAQKERQQQRAQQEKQQQRAQQEKAAQQKAQQREKQQQGQKQQQQKKKICAEDDKACKQQQK